MVEFKITISFIYPEYAIMYHICTFPKSKPRIKGLLLTGTFLLGTLKNNDRCSKQKSTKLKLHTCKTFTSYRYIGSS